MNLEAFEMKEQHRQLLARNRVYLLHNLRPTESLWSMLIAKEIFPPDMIAEIKGCQLTSEKIGKLLDLLPARGPNAFDDFCEALLECDHAHVADYLKTLEATDHFRRGIQPHCLDVSDTMLDRLVNIFKKSTPTVQRFAERKFALILEEQERDLHYREAEVKDLATQNMLLELEVTQLRSFMNSCTETMESLRNEVERDFLSVYFLREEHKHLENLKCQMKGVNGFSKVVDFYNNMQNLLQFLEAFAGLRINDNKDNNSYRNAEGTQPQPLGGENERSVQQKMQALVSAIKELYNEAGTKPSMPSLIVCSELDKILKQVHEIVADFATIKDTFKATIRQKRKLESEVLSMLQSFQEIRRLEREVKEKQTHITELNKQGQIMRKKTKHHRKQLEQIQLNIEQKKIQGREIQKVLERHMNSADQRLHSMLNLLPDLDENDNVIRSDTDLTSVDASDTSRIGTPANDRPSLIGAGTPLNENRDREATTLSMTAGNSREDNIPSTRAVKNIKVRFASQTQPGDKSLDPSKTKPKEEKGAARGKLVLLKQRTNVSNVDLSARRSSKHNNDGVRLESIDPELSKSKPSLLKDSVRSDSTQNLAGDRKQSQQQNNIDKWVSEQNKRGKTQEIQRKLALFQHKSDRYREKEEEKAQNVRETLAKTDRQISNLSKLHKKDTVYKEEPIEPQHLVESSSNSSSANTGQGSSAKQLNTEQHTSRVNVDAVSNKDSHSSSGNSAQSSTRQSGISHSSPGDDKRDEVGTLLSSRRQRVSHHITMVDSERGTAGATVATLSTETLNLPGQTSARHSYSHMLSNQKDFPPLKKQENRQTLSTNKVLIRLPSQ